MSLRLRGAGVHFLAPVLFGRTASVVAGRTVAPCWCVPGWCGASQGVWRLVLARPSVTVACFGVVVCCGALCCVVLCFVVLSRAGPCRVSVRPAGSRRVAPCRAVVCRAVLCPVVSCCGVFCLWGALSWCVAHWCAVVRCAVLPRVVPWWVGGCQSGPPLCVVSGSECGWLVAGGCG